MTSSPRTVSPVGLPPLRPLSPFPFCPFLGYLGHRLKPRLVSLLGAAAGRFAGHAGRRLSCPSGWDGRARSVEDVVVDVRAPPSDEGLGRYVLRSFRCLGSDGRLAASFSVWPRHRLDAAWDPAGPGATKDETNNRARVSRARLCLRMLWIVARYCRLLGICPAIVQQNGPNPADTPLIETFFEFVT